MSRRFLTVVAITVALGASPWLSSAQTIDTRPPNDNGGWGGYTAGVMLGQTFSTPGPVYTFLNTFALDHLSVAQGEPTSYTAFLAEWDNTANTSGSQLWSTSGSDLTNDLSDFSFTVNTQLAFGQNYIFVMSFDANNGLFASGTTPYAGGGFYYHDGPDATGPWNDFYAAEFDLAFSADFSASSVPEPGSIILLGSGLIGLAGVAFRRRYPLV